MSFLDYPPSLRETIEWMRLFAIVNVGETKLSDAERRKVLYALNRTIEELDKRGVGEDSRKSELIQQYSILKQLKDFRVFDVKQVLYLITNQPLERTESHYGDRRLERRMMELEHELSRLRSNPALEKKVAKLEKELQKIRVASVVSLEGNEKEQKDMLKNYKEAERRVFVIMPFAPIYDDVWKGGVERACNSEEFGYMRVDKISLSSWITEDIVKYIEMADFVITDISGNNPNVMFELGWALAKGKKPIVIRQQDDPNKVPFDVKDIRYISYTNSWSGIERLYRDICKFLKTTSEAVKEEAPKKKTRQKKSTKAKED